MRPPPYDSLEILSERTPVKYLLAGALAIATGLAAAQSFPSKPIRILVPSPAGSSPDIRARQIGAKLAEALGQPGIVENRPRANGPIAARRAAVAAPLKAGKLRALAVMGPARLAMFPEVPTSTEAGLPGVEAIAWNGIFVPAGTPRAAINVLHRELVKAYNAPDVKSQVLATGSE